MPSPATCRSIRRLPPRRSEDSRRLHSALLFSVVVVARPAAPHNHHSLPSEVTRCKLWLQLKLLQWRKASRKNSHSPRQLLSLKRKRNRQVFPPTRSSLACQRQLLANVKERSLLEVQARCRTIDSGRGGPASATPSSTSTIHSILVQRRTPGSIKGVSMRDRAVRQLKLKVRSHAHPAPTRKQRTLTRESRPQNSTTRRTQALWAGCQLRPRRPVARTRVSCSAPRRITI